MRRRGAQLTLSTEHRAAASQDHIPIQLTQVGSALALSVAAEDSSIPEPGNESGGRQTLQRVQQILAGLEQPVTVQQLRKLCGLRTATVCSCLAQLADIKEGGNACKKTGIIHFFLPQISATDHPSATCRSAATSAATVYNVTKVADVAQSLPQMTVLPDSARRLSEVDQAIEKGCRVLRARQGHASSTRQGQR
jgi:hypothetical protein